MLTTAALLLRGSLFLSLHLTGGISSFPKPLSAEEEKRYIQRWAEDADRTACLFGGILQPLRFLQDGGILAGVNI